MHAGRLLGLGEIATSPQVASPAIGVTGLAFCPAAVPVGFGFGPTCFLAMYRIAYERALSSVAAQSTLYDRLMAPCWN